MENLTREGLRALGVADEAIDKILEVRGNEITKFEEQKSSLLKELKEVKDKALKVDDLSKKISELEKKNMTAEELQAQRLKEAEEAKKKYTILSNETKVKDILMQAGMASGETLDKIVSKITNEDTQSTIETAKLVADMYNATKVETEKKVKENLLSDNPKPSPSNALENKSKITAEQFSTMSYDDMMKFANENPDEFAKM